MEPKTLTPARVQELWNRSFWEFNALAMCELQKHEQAQAQHIDALTAEVANAKLRWEDWQQVATDRSVEIHRLTAEVAALRTVAYAKCEWTLDDDNGNKWDTTCDRAFTFLEDGPVENRYRFCPGCGKSVALREAPLFKEPT